MKRRSSASTLSHTDCSLPRFSTRMRWLTILLLPAACLAYCPEFFKNQTACSCFDNLDGSVIRCSGQEGPMMVEQMKKLHFEIRELTLENANIVEIGPRAFKNLRIRKLVLDKNRIKAIHKDALRGLENVLQELSLAQNKLTEVPSDAVAGMRALSVLNLKCNRIGNLTKSVFQKLDSLIDVNLSCNEVCEVSSDVFDGVRNTLQNLILDSNCLKMFPAGAVKNMEALIALHLKGNKINTIGEGELTNLTSLAMLSLSNNNISFIHPSALQNTPNLRYVYLAGNKIQSLASGTMTQLKQTQVLDLAFNQLSEIGEETFAGLESLQHLNLESNNIQSIASGAFAGIPLLLLWLPNNCLNLITPATFQGALFLRQLSLANNNIKEIQPLSFNHLANLHTVDLANNRIRSLQQGAIQGSDHLTVRLQENPMVCLQDGFHVMNGNQAINLTTEPNNICKTNWHDESDKVCSKATTSPVTLQCCKRNSVAVSALITSTAAPATTSTEEDEPEDEKETEEKEDGDDEVDRQAVSRAHSNEEETTTETTRSSSTYQTTRAPTRTVNMDRFWRLSHRPAADIPRRQTSTVLRSRYLATNAKQSEQRTRQNFEKEEEEDENEEQSDEEDAEEEEDTTMESTTTKMYRKVPAQIHERQKMLTNMMPPWLLTTPVRKNTDPEEAFSKDQKVETESRDESIH